MMTFIVTFFLFHAKAVHLEGFLEFQILRVSWFPGICVFLNSANSREPKIGILHGMHSYQGRNKNRIVSLCGFVFPKSILFLNHV